VPPPLGPSGDPPKTSSADWRPTASENEAFHRHRVRRRHWCALLLQLRNRVLDPPPSLPATSALRTLVSRFTHVPSTTRKTRPKSCSVLLLPAPTSTSRAKLTSKLATASTEKHDKKLAASTTESLPGMMAHTQADLNRVVFASAATVTNPDDGITHHHPPRIFHPCRTPLQVPR
jgi:hypothetical protein